MEHTHLKNSWLHHHHHQHHHVIIHTNADVSHPQQHSHSSKISPAILFVIVVVAVLFFISGFLHLLIRFLRKRPNSSHARNNNRVPQLSATDALQRQLQQLFHLHDSGLDQAFIDSLPVFHYKEIVGLKESADCPVCLCEFSDKDKLRLLPICSHAFHINCIDTWLLSNSSCPLCRGTLFAPGENPVYDFDDEEGFPDNLENGVANSQKTVEIKEKSPDKGVVRPVRLGKFMKLNGDPEIGGEASSSNLDARRCYSMGSYQYVLGNSILRVSLSNNQQTRDIKLIENKRNASPDDGSVEGKKISTVTKGESFSVSKIWLWSKKGKFSSSSDSPINAPAPLQIDLPSMRSTEDK
ncbi:hypothetical protein ACFE04_007940 [Oxalis oulophora]